MPTNVFISFERHDLERVNSIRALANNPQHDLEFHDCSEIHPETDKRGTPLPYQPDDSRSKPIKKKLKELLKQSTKMIVVIGKFTYRSNWVEWEIQSFYNRYNSKSNDGDKRVLAVYVPEASDKDLPRIIRSLGIPQTRWNMNTLTQWINVNPTQQFTSLPLLFT
jgi:hypothetical protein